MTYQKLTKYVTIFMLTIFMLVSQSLTLQAETKTSQDIVDSLSDTMPTIVGDKVVLPTVEDGFEVILYGSDNKQIIDMNLNYYQPLVNQSVHIMYKVVNTDDTTDIGISKEDITVNVKGKYSDLAGDNSKPNVIPNLREWKGGTGNFEINSTSRIIFDFSKIEESFVKKTIKKYLDNYSKENLKLVNGDSSLATSGDIVIEYDETIEDLGNEGYYINIDDVITIAASDTRGINYAGVSLGQILHQSLDGKSIPKGLTRDYPKYEVRAGMLDVGRVYMPLEYVEEITEYMSWYKLNELQLHINDYWNASNYTAFRVESKVYPEINAKDGYYTQEEYIKYQEDMKVYGIDVITEIDTPFHADVFKLIDPSLVWKPGHLDIRTPESREKVYEVVETLYDEFLGDSPTDPNRVFLSSKFHIGTDEYDHTYSEQMRIYTDHMLNYVNNKGYESRLWGELGTYGYDGEAEVTNDATMTIWAPYRSDTQEMYDLGYDIINVTGGDLYIVPVGNAGFPDYLDIKEKYDAFEVNNYMGSGRSGSKGGAIMPFAHPQTKGAMFALWNDMTSFNGGLSSLDIFNRYKDGIYLISEKTWFGEKQDNQTSDEFMERVSAVETFNPLSNPSFRYLTENTTILEYDFESVEGNVVKDKTGNGYDALIKGNNNVVDGVLKLDGSTTLELPIESLGYPYSVSFNLKLNGEQLSNATLLKSQDGEVQLSVSETEKLGFIRNERTSEESIHKFENYEFSFNKKLEVDEWHNIRIDGDNTHTNLYIDNIHIARAEQINRPGKRVGDSTTLLLPLRIVGENIVGELDNFKIYDRSMQSSLRRNFALDAKATASTEYNNVQAISNINDGDTASRWGSVYQDNQWVILEMDQVRTLNEFVIRWESARAKEYKLFLSLDGVNYDEIYTHNSTNPGTDTIILDEPTDAKFVKLEMIKRSNSKYGFSIFEFELYGLQDFEYGRTLAQKAQEELEYISHEFSGDTERLNLENAITNMLSVYEENEINVINYDEFLKDLVNNYEAFVKSIVELENLALNQKVTAQSTHPGSATLKLSPEFLVDGNMSTRWGSDYRAASGFPNTESWVTIEFDNLTELDMLVLRWEGARSKDYTVSYSVDNETFEPLLTFDKYKDKDYNDVLMFVPVEIKTLRFDFKGNVTKYGFSLYELEAYNTSGLIDAISKTKNMLAEFDKNLYNSEIANIVLGNESPLENYFKSFERNAIEYHKLRNEITKNYSYFVDSIVTPDLIKILSSETEMKMNETQELTLEYNPVDVYYSSIKWESSDNTILSVTKDGVVTTHTSGTATITAIMEFDNIKSPLSTSIEITVVEESMVDKDKLIELVNTVKELEEANYTPESYGPLIEYLVIVEEMLNEDLTDTQVLKAYDTLKKLLDALELAVEIDTTELETLITEFETLNENEYTPESFAPLKEKIKQAKELLNGFYTEEDIKKYANEIKELLETLVEVVEVDIAKLEQLIAEVESLNEELFTPETYNPLKSKVMKAKTLLEGSYTQDDIDQMINSIETLKEKLEEKEVLNTSDLDVLIRELKELNLEEYTEQSAKIIEVALEKAQEDYDDIQSQEDIDTIVKYLNGIKENVVKKSEANIDAPFKGLPAEIKVGDVFTLIPEYDNQLGEIGWEYNTELLSATFNSPATFTALKEGESTIMYTDEYGRVQTAHIKVVKADDVNPPVVDNGNDIQDDSKTPTTGISDSISYVWIVILSLATFILFKVFRRGELRKNIK